MQTVLRHIHPLAGGLAILCIATFMGSTLVAELHGDPQTIIITKRAILWGLLVLVPCLALTGFSGYQMAGGAPSGVALGRFRHGRGIRDTGLWVLVPWACFVPLRAYAPTFE